MREILENDRFAEHLCRRVDDARQRRALHAQLGERLVHAAVERDFLVLFGHDEPVHRLGDVDELDHAVQCDQCQIQRFGDAAGRLRQRGALAAELHDDSGGAGLGEPLQIGLGRVP
jgi:hypothetical protein